MLHYIAPTFAATFAATFTSIMAGSGSGSGIGRGNGKGKGKAKTTPKAIDLMIAPPFPPAPQLPDGPAGGTGLAVAAAEQGSPGKRKADPTQHFVADRLPKASKRQARAIAEDLRVLPSQRGDRDASEGSRGRLV